MNTFIIELSHKASVELLSRLKDNHTANISQVIEGLLLPPERELLCFDSNAIQKFDNRLRVLSRSARNLDVEFNSSAYSDIFNGIMDDPNNRYELYHLEDQAKIVAHIKIKMFRGTKRPL